MTYIPLLNGKMRISIFAPAAFWLMAVSEGLLPFFVIASAAVLHELGHLCAIKLCGCRVTRVTVCPFGGLIEHTSAPDTRSAFLTAAGGIAANSLCAITGAAAFAFTKSAYALLFTFASLFFALTNLIPLRTSDGGEMLYVLALRRGEEHAEKLLSRSAAAGRIILALLAALILWLSDFNNGLCVALLIAATPSPQAANDISRLSGI